MGERVYWLGFSAFNGVGPKRFKLLIENFGSASSAFKAKTADISEILGEALTSKFDKFRNEFNIKLYAEELRKKQVDFLILSDKDYPQLLKQINNPPFVLYVRGEKKILNQVQNNQYVAVVGTRKTTHYGREVTQSLTNELAMAGFTIVSGLATGIDTVAHQTALSNKGKTIAVLGSGVDYCTPPTNLKLYNDIIANGGCIVSELPLGHPPTKGSFPARNRIIAGLSQGILVTEGAEDSGALITADYAFANNRKVFAVPGPITSGMSKGPYKLISKGAKLVTKAGDILNELKIHPDLIGTSIKITDQKLKVSGTKEEREILNLLENEELHFDEIVRKTKINSSKIASIISFMEIKGLIKNQGGIFSSQNSIDRAE